MSRWLKAVFLTLALAALISFATSCSSSAPAQIRFVNAIQDADPLDINVTGPDSKSIEEFTNVGFLGVQPNQPGYTSVPSGRDTVQAFLTGTTTPVFTDSVSWGSAAHYTVVGTGFAQTGTNGSDVVLLSVPDNIAAPPTGDVEFRVIHASPSGPVSVDIYIELNPSTGPLLPITIQGLQYTQASKYVSFSFNPNNDNPPPGFTVYVTAAGSMQPIISEPISPASAGAVRTLVLTDGGPANGGKSMNSSFLELSDLD